MHQGQQAADLAGREALAGEPGEVVARQVGDQPALVLAEGHFPAEQQQQILGAETVQVVHVRNSFDWRMAGRPTKYHPGQPPSSQFQKTMTVRTLLRMGDPRLLETARPVAKFGTAELHELIRDMFDTMTEAGGVGLAAPQIGVGLRVVIFGFEQSERYPDAEAVPRTILINPLITPLTDAEELGFEGCLSVPGLRGEVPRFQRIRYQGFDPRGGALDRTVEGFHARVVQHECDHLIGMLYPMRMRDLSRLGFTDVLFPPASDTAP